MNRRQGRGLRDVRAVAALVVPIVLIGFLALREGGLDLPARQQISLAVWWLLALGVAFAWMPRAMPPGGWRLAAAGILALGGLQLASTAWGPSDDQAIADACRTLGYLGLLAAAWLCLGPRSWKSAAVGLLAVAAAVTAYALFARLAPGITGVDQEFGSGRLAEPLGYWNAMAAWAAMTLAMALSWSADARRTEVRAACAALLPVAATVVYLTYSRGGVVVAALGVALVIGLTRNRRRASLNALVGAAATAFCILAVRSQAEIADGTGDEGAMTVGVTLVLAAAACWRFARASPIRRQRSAPEVSRVPAPRVALAGMGMLAVGLVAVALIGGRDGFGRGGDAGAFADADPSARLTSAAGNRSGYWSEALDGFLAQPLRGEGAGSFSYRWAETAEATDLVSDPHSLLFATGAELGLLGLVALAVTLTGLWSTSARGFVAGRHGPAATGLAAAVGVFAATTVIDWTWESTALASLGIACAGVLAMAASHPLGRPVRGGADGFRPAFRAFVVAGAIVLGAIQVPGSVATSLLRDSEEQRALGHPAEAVAAANGARTAAPWSAAAYAARAEANLVARDLGNARLDARDAVELEPLEAEHWVLLAEVEAARDDLPAALAALRRAVRLSPHEPRLGTRAVAKIGTRLERLGFSADEISTPD